ncbi:hypothetical protein ACRQ5D_21845 [Mucilaginibacter sp. P25]|uniref:hypothetical protein n=2 Tax=unclassified Mucilaginibacter TaxID=2617802 RepID=UPI003D7BF7F1
MKIIILIGLFVAFSWAVFAQKSSSYRFVEAKKSNKDTVWTNYKTKTLVALSDFKSQTEPPLNKYGSWEMNKQKGTGYFRTEKINDRWWFIDPDGYPFINKGVAVFRPFTSEHQQKILKQKYGSVNNWYKHESTFLKDLGFNGAGAWSDVDLIRNSPSPMVYTVIVNAMGSYKADHIKRFGGKYKIAGWQGYRFDLVMVFDPEFDAYCDAAFKPLSKYKEDKYLLGYYSDNELPWKTDALDISLKNLAKDETGIHRSPEVVRSKKRENFLVSRYH